MSRPENSDARSILGFHCNFYFKGFGISPKQFENEHIFSFEGRQVRISFPKAFDDEYNKNKTPNHQAKCRAYKWSSSKKALRVYVGEARIFVACVNNDNVFFEDSWLNLESNERSKKFRDSNAAALQGEVEKNLSEITHSAFEYWVSVVRWVTRSHFVGEPDLGRRGYSGYESFAVFPSFKHFAPGAKTITVQGCPEVDIRQWNEVQNLINKNFQPPLWFELSCEANKKFWIRDFRGSVIDCAVAIEIIFRQRIDEIFSCLPEPNMAIKKKLDYWQIKDIIKDSGKISSTSQLALSKNEIESLTRVVESRNGILYRRSVGVKEEDAEKSIRTLSMLVGRVKSTYGEKALVD